MLSGRLHQNELRPFNEWVSQLYIKTNWCYHDSTNYQSLQESENFCKRKKESQKGNILAMAQFNGLGLHLGNISRLSAAKTRSISPENFTGEKGKGGMATSGTGEDRA